jgi:hypothetical protein
MVEKLSAVLRRPFNLNDQMETAKRETLEGIPRFSPDSFIYRN